MTLKPFSGVRVVEMSNMVTASLSAMMLGGQGAEVVKIEPLGIGDKLRWFGSQKKGISGVFNNCNRGKKSLAINLKSKKGLAAVRKIIDGADVLLHNYRPGVMKKLGLDSASLRKHHPDLIVCSLTGFGREGPLKDAPAFDHVVQALSGITGAQGVDGNFEFIRMLVCDKITAYTAAQAVSAALYHVAKTGEGQHMDISMLQASLAFMWPDGMMHKTLLAGDAVHLAPMKAYYRLVETLDGFIAIAPFGDAHWTELFRIIERPDMAANPKYASLQSRGVCIAELMEDMAEPDPFMTNAEFLAKLRAADIPCAPCLSDEDLLLDTQVAASGAIETQDHPHLGAVQMASAPVRFGGETPMPLGPSPLLGENSAEILKSAGFSAQDISDLEAAQII